MPAWPAVAWNACTAALRTASARPAARVSSFSAIRPEPYPARRILGGVLAVATVHLHPTAPLAERALLPGDPGRALALAQALFDAPARMFNHNRGLWGYTGTATDGAPLTVQSTGIGGPSAAVVLEELCDLGLRCAIRVGTCTALDGRAAPGDLVAVREALPADGTSRALGAQGPLGGDEALTAALAVRADRSGAVVSSDLFYDPRPGERAAWAAAGALAVDLETAAVLAVARRRGIRAAAVLAVVARGDERLGPEEIDEAGVRLGRAALEALAPAPAA
jgi:uridine phosphorylase